MVFLKNHIKIISLTLFLLVALVTWYGFVVPHALSIPQDFSAELVLNSQDNFYSPEAEIYLGWEDTIGGLRYQVQETNDSTYLMTGVFDIKKNDGTPIITVEKDFTLDPISHQHINTGGVDATDAPYLFGPIMSGLVTQENRRSGFTYYQPNYPFPIQMEYLSEELVDRLVTYRYKSSFSSDQTKELTGVVPGVGETLGAKSEAEVTIWVEPYTGRIVKYSEEGLSTIYSLETKEIVYPRNKYRNSFAVETQRKILEEVSEEKLKNVLYQYGLVVLVLVMFLFALLFKNFLSYSVERARLDQGITGNSGILPLVVLVSGLAVSAAIAYVSHTLIEREVITDFQNLSEEIQQNIDTRVKVYESALLGSRGFVDSSEEVSRDEWKTYVASLNIQEQFPGIQGIGVSVFVKPEEKEEHEEAIQSEGYPEFTIRPEGERGIYTSIIYLEPFDERNRQAFGFDMFQEQNRNAAMSYARDNNASGLSGKVTLVQEITDDVQSGFLLYVPFYEKGVTLDTLTSRRESIIGYVYSPFRMGDFMSNIVPPQKQEIQVEIYDAEREEMISEDSLMYNSLSAFGNGEEKRFRDTVIYKEYDFGGRTWTMKYKITENFEMDFFRTYLPALLGLASALISVFLFMLVLFLSNRQRNAMRIAQTMTKDLRAEKENAEGARIKAEVEKNKLTAVISNMAEGLVVLDAEGKIVIVNKTFESLLGISKSEAIGQKYVDLVPLYDAGGNTITAEKRLVNMAREGGGRVMDNLRENYFYKNSEGVLFPVLMFVAPTELENNTQGVVQVFRDITKELEIDKAKTEFVSLASHQLRTPLTATRWYAELLGETEEGLSGEQQEYVDEIVSSNERMINLVNALLDVSRIELGVFSVENTDISLIEILRSVIGELTPRIEEKKQTVKTDTSSAPDLYHGDPKLIEIILQNLISNAIKYTPQEGEIAISIAVPDDKDVLAIKVSDTGYGIPESQQGEIFNKMFRADNIKALDTDGTGLGLYIVRAIIRQVEGSIRFESELNKGTTFFVELPRAGMKEKAGLKPLNG